jgi:hypothetical protein
MLGDNLLQPRRALHPEGPILFSVKPLTVISKMQLGSKQHCVAWYIREVMHYPVTSIAQGSPRQEHPIWLEVRQSWHQLDNDCRIHQLPC